VENHKIFNLINYKINSIKKYIEVYKYNIIRMNTLTILNNNDDITLSTAELFYNRYKKYMRDYRQLNPKKMSESCKRYTNKLKSDPVTNALMLEKRKKYYHDVVAPRKKLLRQCSQ